MEQTQVEAGDNAIRDKFHEATKDLIDHLIKQNRMSNQSFLDRLDKEMRSCQRYGFDYHEQRLNAAAMKPLTEDEQKEVRAELRKEWKELVASSKVLEAMKKAGITDKKAGKFFDQLNKTEEVSNEE